MAAAQREVGILFLAQMGLGILGNFSLLYVYNFPLFMGRKVRPTDLILSQLALANSFVLFSRGVPHTIAVFGSKYFLNEAGCKFLFYFHRVARGVSFTTATLLSVFQTVKLCPSFSRWMEFRMRSPKCIGFCCSLCWVLHLFVNSVVPVNMIGPKHSKNTSVKINYEYCSSLNADRTVKFVVVVVFFTVDFVCLGLTVCASGSVVVFLHRHRQRVQHIHSNSRSSRSSAEVRATGTILILVGSFFSFYSLSSLLSIWMTVFVIPGQWLVDTSMFLSSCFPAFSPFVLICSDTRITRFYFTCWTRKTFFPT
uniref:Vomeronasal type-1 receptor n=1 Tax=Catagonus wagneri TaxID=51154 RepID=A0A8C3WNN1_9CETA